MNQSEAEMNFFAAYDACKDKSMGDASTRKDEEAGLVQLVALRTSPARFQPAREYLPRVDLHV